MEGLKYTNEFLKKLEEIVVKNDLKTLHNIKHTLENISKEKTEKQKLINTKTSTGSEIFISQTEAKLSKYDIIWTEEKEQKTIITIIKTKK